MHKIEIVVQPDCLGRMSEALRKAKIGPFRTSAITVVDPAAPPDGSYRGTSYAIGRERVKLEFVVPDHEVEPALETIQRGIDAFGSGDAELVVLEVQSSVRVSALAASPSRADRDPRARRGSASASGRRPAARRRPAAARSPSSTSARRRSGRRDPRRSPRTRARSRPGSLRTPTCSGSRGRRTTSARRDSVRPPVTSNSSSFSQCGSPSPFAHSYSGLMFSTAISVSSRKFFWSSALTSIDHAFSRWPLSFEIVRAAGLGVEREAERILVGAEEGVLERGLHAVELELVAVGILGRRDTVFDLDRLGVVDRVVALAQVERALEAIGEAVLDLLWRSSALYAPVALARPPGHPVVELPGPFGSVSVPYEYPK